MSPHPAPHSAPQPRRTHDLPTLLATAPRSQCPGEKPRRDVPVTSPLFLPHPPLFLLPHGLLLASVRLTVPLLPSAAAAAAGDNRQEEDAPDHRHGDNERLEIHCGRQGSEPSQGCLGGGCQGAPLPPIVCHLRATKGRSRVRAAWRGCRRGATPSPPPMVCHLTSKGPGSSSHTASTPTVSVNHGGQGHGELALPTTRY